VLPTLAVSQNPEFTPTQKIETIARNIDLVSRYRGTYANDYTIHVKPQTKGEKPALSGFYLCR
jgi:hypothetical protein